MAINDKLTKPYNPNDTEARIYEIWEEKGYFQPESDRNPEAKNNPVFSIVLPPPNVTGNLHLGHSAMLAIEDIMVRYHRMRGDNTLWLPGTDHAAIATQSKVEKIIYKAEKKSRHDLGREEFLKRVVQFASDSHDTIVGQCKKMGASLDWTREAFTLDEARNLAVRTAFKMMYDAGLIYRGHRIVNWDPKLQTTVSDDEIEWKEEKVPLYYLKYGPFTIATARPETKFGDKYVVMHPDDPRYAAYEHGQKVDVEWINGKVTATVIKDPVIDMEFGTGVMTITPWHDATDFDLSLRHNLEKEQIIDLRGKLMPIAGEFAGLHITNARPLLIEKLKEKGLVEKIEEGYVHRIATNSRGGGVIEPQILEQWFIDVNKKVKLPHSKLNGIQAGQEVSLKELLQTVVKNGQIKIIPERFEKTYFSWVDNLRDWCISRQIWYGHRIPVWYRGKEIYCGINSPEGEGWEQDPDTLDTWFSSGLWTFSTLGWPNNTEDLQLFHPTTVLETGYDIIFFWVARMILMTTYILGDIPFYNVYLHGLVRTESGVKMSKSLDNAIDPIDMISKYGADATRLSLIIGTSPGNDLKVSENRTRGYKNFTNKIWNITRFVLTNIEGANLENKPELTSGDITILKEFNELIAEITNHIEKYQFYLAGDKLYHYTWHVFADKIIEESKAALRGDDTAAKISAQWKLNYILRNLLKLLHPFIPFITEEIWSLMGEERMLIVSEWPHPSD